ncbi:MAG: hypothetical protein J3K34DRAFT_415360 [Monoraphidium minutum]|nr:MAG: hypothetical protein J3K34DRAFT_415360 [Monoraphidium minutum]
MHADAARAHVGPLPAAALRGPPARPARAAACSSLVPTPGRTADPRRPHARPRARARPLTMPGCLQRFCHPPPCPNQSAHARPRVPWAPFGIEGRRPLLSRAHPSASCAKPELREACVARAPLEPRASGCGGASRAAAAPRPGVRNAFYLGVPLCVARSCRPRVISEPGRRQPPVRD